MTISLRFSALTNFLRKLYSLGSRASHSKGTLRAHGNEFSFGPPKDKQEMISLLRNAVERGIAFFDTADVY